MKLALGVTLLTLLLPACGDGDDDDGNNNTGPDGGSFPDAPGDATGGPTPLNCDGVEEVEGMVPLEYEEIVDGLDFPGAVEWAPGDARPYVMELKSGKIRIIENGAPLPTPFLDVGAKIRTTGTEEGLLGFVFHSDYDSNGRFFIHYTRSADGASVIEEYARSDGDPDRADVTAKLIFSTPSFADNHNGGHLAFGPDGYLYIGFGDGGDANDYRGHAQYPETPQGSMLRIDIDNGDPYSVPATNPDFGENALPETWAYGLRNPWRYTFDAKTGELYIADVGQATREEVSVVPLGDGGYNFGWSCYEGTFEFALNVEEPNDEKDRCPDPAATFTHPIYEYDRSTENGSITGGYVYRGCKLPAYRGTYFFAEYERGQVWSFVKSGDQATGVRKWTGNHSLGNLDINGPTSFGQDHQGELYVVGAGVGPGTGKVMKIVPAS